LEFTEIHSIEIKSEHHAYAKKRFQYDSNVKLYLGNSAELLPQILERVKDQITFWLDAHIGGGRKSTWGKDPCPLIQELTAIKTHPIKTHTILIDDIQMFKLWNIQLEDVLDTIQTIADYQISYADGIYQKTRQKKDIIVAIPRRSTTPD